jgi:hypothetical protein
LNVNDPDASAIPMRRVVGGEGNLPPIGGPDRMVRVQGTIGHLNEPGSVAIDEENGVQPGGTSTSRFERQLLAVGRPGWRSSLTGALLYGVRRADIVNEPN